jgi:hypothetical protein
MTNFMEEDRRTVNVAPPLAGRIANPVKRVKQSATVGERHRANDYSDRRTLRQRADRPARRVQGRMDDPQGSAITVQSATTFTVTMMLDKVGVWDITERRGWNPTKSSSPLSRRRQHSDATTARTTAANRGTRWHQDEPQIECCRRPPRSRKAERNDGTAG